MFMGEYQHTLDGKGRLILPAKIREGLGETFIATRGLDECLFIYTMEEWTALETFSMRNLLYWFNAGSSSAIMILAFLEVRSTLEEWIV